MDIVYLGAIAVMVLALRGLIAACGRLGARA
jgi:hypothetical protein